MKNRLVLNNETKFNDAIKLLDKVKNKIIDVNNILINLICIKNIKLIYHYICNLPQFLALGM